MKYFRNTVSASLALLVLFSTALAQKSPAGSAATSIPANTLLRIIRAEDQRRWDDNLKSLLGDKSALVRRRAALAAGRIGDEHAVPALSALLKHDGDADVRQMAVFAIGEVESASGAEALLDLLKDTQQRGEIRARAVEALGKITAALPESDKDKRKTCGEAILGVLRVEAGRRSAPHRETILLGLTATLRARPEGAGAVVSRFFGYTDPRIVADALNTLARLRLKDGVEQVRPLLGNGDPIVRANAARLLGGAEDKQSFDELLSRALNDSDPRVRVTAIRALAALKDQRAAQPLISRGKSLLASNHSQVGSAEKNELLEIATSIGRVLQQSNNGPAISFLRELRVAINFTAPEVEVAFARVDPTAYLEEQPFPRLLAEPPVLNPIDSWQQQAAIAQALREVANFKSESSEAIPVAKERAEQVARVLGCFEVSGLTGECTTEIQGEADTLRAYAAFKPADLAMVLRKEFELISTKSKGAPKGIYAVPSEIRKGEYQIPNDVITRATAAELLGELPPDIETSKTLIEALPISFHDNLNDATQAILDALAKQKTAAANDAIKTALNSADYLIRRQAVALLKANGAGDFFDRIAFLNTRNTVADYRRAMARIGKRVRATLLTSKGAFAIEFLPEDAPLTVDNFVQLTRKGYFNGITFHRVVPNFVIQGGDPRGDGNGGPGYSIRCEINESLFDRAAVGMALSGKDTGGSQWFVTHSPQPHLDGGYTVFGRVVSGMDVVDRITRGDTIRRVMISEK